MATTLQVGDIALIGYSSDTGGKSFAFVLLTAVDEGTVITFTDNGWFAAGGFRSGEGTVAYTAPAGGAAAGTVVSFTGLTGSLNFSTAGDSLVAFQGTFSSAPTSNGGSGIVPIYALDFADANTTFAAEAINTNTSAIPRGLTLGSTALAFAQDNGAYTGTTSGTKAQLQAAIADAANWTLDDATPQAYKTSFTVSSGSVVGAVIINDVSVVEGDSGTSLATFTVTRSDTATAFTVDYATQDGTALAGQDYAATNGTLTFTAGGAASQTFTVTLNGDTTVEANETFTVNLSNLLSSSGSTSITDAQGVGTIANDDTSQITISDVTIAEGGVGGTQVATFTVTRSSSGGDFTLAYATQDGTATAGSDYTATSGSLTFTAGGAASQTVSVAITGDTTIEAAETFSVLLSSLVQTSGSAAIADGTGVGTIQNDDFIAIHDIQGAAHVSPLVGQSVTTSGIVTARASNGYWLQDPNPDSNDATSEGIFVFTSTAPPTTAAVGNLVSVAGTVIEFKGSGRTNDLSLTEISGPTTTLITSGNPLPTAILLGTGGRGGPTVSLGDDDLTGTFDPATQGTDFYESLESMLVTINDAVTTSGFRSNFGEIYVRYDTGANPSVNARGGITISDTTPNTAQPADKVFDFNPERIQIDDRATGGSTPALTAVGERLGSITGVIGYEVGAFDLNTTSAVTIQQASTLQREVTDIGGNLDRIRVASFNVENLTPVGGRVDGVATTQAKLDGIADAIIINLKAPEILALQEVLDNDGETNSSDVSATTTLTQLINTIANRGGPRYTAIDSVPFDDTVGGTPGGNQRVAYLYLADAVTPTARNGLTTVTTDSNGAPVVQQAPTANQIGQGNTDFNATRKSLPMEWAPAGYTDAQGGTFYTVDNHFSSKGGSAPLQGSLLELPLYADPLNGSSQKTSPTDSSREGQAEAVNAYIDGVLSNASATDNRIVALGDFNDFQFFPVIDLVTGQLVRTTVNMSGTPSVFAEGTAVMAELADKLPVAERYSYNFDGQAQELDQILISSDLYASTLFDIVHINSEFATQISDHDPSVASLLLPRSAALATTGGDTLDQTSFTAAFGAIRGSLAGSDTMRGLDGNDVISSGAGNDFIYGDAGNDVLTGGADSDVIDGGAGIDTARFSGLSKGYTLSLFDSMGTVSGGPEGGVDALSFVENVRFFDGTLTFTPDGVGGSVARLYSVLKRAPDPAGLANFENTIEKGATLSDVAAVFLNSAEFAQVSGGGSALSDADYVNYLYDSMLNRAADAGGFQHYTQQLLGGVSRVDVLLAFSQSGEHRVITGGALASGIWEGDEDASGIAAIFDAAFDRMVDDASLSTYQTALSSGSTLRDVARSVESSTEFQTRFAAESNADFVEDLYAMALNRAPDAGGQGFWVGQLDSNSLTRADVLYSFAAAQEHQNLIFSYTNYELLYG